MRAAVQWSRGNFEARANLGQGRSEIKQVGQTFDRMADQLGRQKEENAAFLAILEDQVAERTRTLNAAQTELKDANASLEAHARELTNANDELQAEMHRREVAEASLRHSQRIEALGELTGGVAHDFNNILQIMLGNLEVLRRDLGGEAPDKEKIQRAIEVAVRAGERASTLTHQLLAFARRQPLAPASLDVNRLISGMSDLLHRTLGETIELEVVLGARLWFVLADAGELESAIVNLAVNARDAMPAGGKLTIETSNTFLDEAYAAAEPEVRHGQYVSIAVTDMGTGMTPETMARAFEPFFTTKDLGRGTGLGLSQVYGFIKQSGGHVKIYSELVKGTTVKLYLPRFANAAAEISAEIAADAPPLRGNAEAVLVVEDDVDVRNSAVDVLRELGYDAIPATDGHAALQAISTRTDIKLLFTDVVLPRGLDGRQLAEEAKRRLPQIKVLYATGYARNAIVHQGRLDPGVELITKPFTYRALALKIWSLLNEDAG
ncbi:MAG: response regulator [Alphaproteobacteria bacterium]|nr:response regulator [Alphaproteobacteria bacterium]